MQSSSIYLSDRLGNCPSNLTKKVLTDLLSRLHKCWVRPNTKQKNVNCNAEAPRILMLLISCSKRARERAQTATDLELNPTSL